MRRRRRRSRESKPTCAPSSSLCLCWSWRPHVKGTKGKQASVRFKSEHNQGRLLFPLQLPCSECPIPGLWSRATFLSRAGPKLLPAAVI